MKPTTRIKHLVNTADKLCKHFDSLAAEIGPIDKHCIADRIMIALEQHVRSASISAGQLKAEIDKNARISDAQESK